MGLKPRQGTLSSETMTALHHTLAAFLQLCQYLLEKKNFHYVLLGKFQTDNLEFRFSQYRQMSGSNYLVFRRFSSGLATQTGKKAYVTETATKRNHISVCDGPSESLVTRMNAGNESRQEAVCRKMEDLNTAKTKVIIGQWNVRTMYEAGKLAQVTAEMRRYGLHVLGISESQWTGSGRLRTATGETLIYSGREDNRHREGGAVILIRDLRNASWSGNRSTAE
ncbi:craniofacial development protein 2-like [Aplysia californica]|uniref:Craniofacial development protein 2-like n=1 Tax=Aplysia californica TaxID=6500 RepID=A0ABM0K9H8_APLCA|nr:craniofacial development protein 2-like [Aplysia californica]